MNYRTLLAAFSLTVATATLAASPPLRYEVVDLLKALPALPKTPAEAARYTVDAQAGGTLKGSPLDAYRARLDAYVASHRRVYDETIAPNVERATKINAAGVAAGGMDFQRMQSDPAYAAAQQQRLAGMSQAEQMAVAMQMQQAMMGQAMSAPAEESGALENSAAVEAAIAQADAQTQRLMDARMAATQQAIAAGGDPWEKQVAALNAPFDARADAVAGSSGLDSTRCPTIAETIA